MELGGAFVVTNTIITDTGLATAPYRGTQTFTNCVFSDNSYAIMYWSHWTGTGSYTNCVFHNILADWVETQGSNAYRNNLTFKNNVFYNPAGTGKQSFFAVGTDGNIWANPLFRDAIHGDFHLRAGSPCIDAADGTTAPATDITGTARYDDQNIINYDDHFADIGVYEFVDNAPSFIDLVPVELLVAPSIHQGEIITVQWSVQNNGSAAASGNWTDSFYLRSADGSGTEIFLGESLHIGNLAAGDIATYWAQFIVPNIPEGNWTPLVFINPNREIFEGQNNGNNELVASSNTAMTVQELAVPGGTFDLVARQTGLFKITVPAEQSFYLNAESTKAVNIYASSGILPSDSNYDYSGNIGDDGKYSLFIPSAGATRSFYILFDAGNQPTSIQYSVTNEKFKLLGVDHHELVTGGKTTVIVNGAGFNDQTVFTFTLNGVAVPMTKVSVDSSLARLTLDLTDALPGTCQVSAARGTATLSLDSGIIVRAPRATEVFTNLLDAFSFTITAPGTIRVGREYSGTVSWKNISSYDISLDSLPQVLLTATNVTVSTPYGNGNRVEIQLSGGKVANLLRPGESGSFTFTFKGPLNTAYFRIADSNSKVYAFAASVPLLSDDPNEIDGPVGYDFTTVNEGTEDEPFLVITTPNWINAVEEQNFRIYFENKSTATAAAQEVFIDFDMPEEWNRESFNVSEISIGNQWYNLNNAIKVADNVWLVNQTSTGEQIRISVSVDWETGHVRWYLRSWVADTADHFPADAYSGFLPPNNKEVHDGEGYVSFSVSLNSGIASGTRIEEFATIIFDANEPIVTNTWVNTLDVTAPVSVIQSIVLDETDKHKMTVTWSGTDEHSGIASFDVYYSTDNGETYTKWLSQTTATSGIFENATPDTTYLFKVIAYDNVGNTNSGVIGAITLEPDRPFIQMGNSEYIVSEDCSVFVSGINSEGEGLSYWWDLSGTGDGEFVEGNASFWLSPSDYELCNGEYTIRLMVKNSKGIESLPVSATLTVNKTIPTVSVVKESLVEDQVLLLDLDVQCYGGRSVNQWTIHWGDGSTQQVDATASHLVVAHYYTPSGEDITTYPLSLTITESNGTEQATQTFSIGSHTVTKTATAALLPVMEQTIETDSAGVAEKVEKVEERVQKNQLTYWNTLPMTEERSSVAIKETSRFDSPRSGKYALAIPAAVPVAKAIEQWPEEVLEDNDLFLDLDFVNETTAEKYHLESDLKELFSNC